MHIFTITLIVFVGSAASSSTSIEESPVDLWKSLSTLFDSTANSASDEDIAARKSGGSDMSLMKAGGKMFDMPIMKAGRKFFNMPIMKAGRRMFDMPNPFELPKGLLGLIAQSIKFAAKFLKRMHFMGGSSDQKHGKSELSARFFQEEDGEDRALKYRYFRIPDDQFELVELESIDSKEAEGSHVVITEVPSSAGESR